uniref:SWIB domain-containing protein n=1 Tax=Strongyloides papillosus TaxID=174720 RepID=A0A0N5BLP6_STREA
MSAKPYGYESSTASEGEENTKFVSNDLLGKRSIKKPKHREDYLENDDYDSAIENALSQEKNTAKNSKKQPSLPQHPRLRNNNTGDLPIDSQSHSTPASEDSTSMHLMDLKLDNMAEKITKTCQEDRKKDLEEIRSDLKDYIKTIVEDNVKMIMSAIENISIQAPLKRKVPKKDSDTGNSGGTWKVLVAEEPKPIFLVGLDVRKVIITKSRDYLDTANKSPDANLRQYLDRHMDINLIAKKMDSPYKLGMYLADIMVPQDVQIKFKFYHSLTRISKRCPLPKDKMSTFKSNFKFE